MITVISDASFSREGGFAAGWAAWCKADGSKSVIASGEVPRGEALSADDAEMYALVRGLRMALEQHPPQRTILLQSDSYRVLRLVRFWLNAEDRPHADGLSVTSTAIAFKHRERDMIHEMRVMASQRSLRLMVRHVKGHTHPSNHGRYWVNRECDRLAKLHMRAQRDRKPCVPEVASADQH
jgi:ribonuclease HI